VHSLVQMSAESQKLRNLQVTKRNFNASSTNVLVNLYVLCMFVSTYKEIKEIRTQLSMVAYLFASPKQHVDQSAPRPASFIDIRPQCHPPSKVLP